jgi:HEAT repeat protein
MRFIPMLFLALTSAAVAQTPAPRPPSAPKPQAAPRAKTPVSPRAAPGQFDLFLPEPGFFDMPPGHWGPQIAMPPSEPFSFEHVPFDFQWHAPLEFTRPVPLAIEPGQLSWTTPFPDVQGIPTPRAMPAPGQLWHSGDDHSPGGTLSRMRPEQGTREDSLYRAAREALNRGEYSRASTLFKALETQYPRSRVAPAVLYWQAFALYRSGATDELRRALEVLRTQQERYPDAAADGEAATLRTRLQAALAARGDAQAAAALRAATAGGPTCDKEDIEVRAEALNALAQINPPEARPTLKKVLARRDECSVQLRRRAVYILGRNGTEESAVDLLEVARTDPDPSVRSDAINLLGRVPGNATVGTLEKIFADAPDDRTRQAVLSALRSRGGPDAKRVLKTIIERNDIPEKMRMEAISQLAGSSRYVTETRSGQTATMLADRVATAAERGNTVDEEDAAYLRGLYGKTQSQAMKVQIISAVARMGGTTNDQWVLGIAKNADEDMRLRREALSRLRSTTLTVDDLGKLFDSLSERELRRAVLQQLARRDEPAATDKLIEIAKSGTDPQIRREAISVLARKNDPRTTKLLLELVEKP